jgi:tetratricopeptide (TPR) repeat protein
MKEAEEMYVRALEGYEEAWGPKHTSTLDTVHNIGTLYYKQSKMKEAEEMYMRALEGKEEAWGPKHTSTLDTVHNLGNLYYQQDRVVEATRMYQWAADGYADVEGDHEAEISYLQRQLSLLRAINSTVNAIHGHGLDDGLAKLLFAGENCGDTLIHHNKGDKMLSKTRKRDRFLGLTKKR